MTTIREEQRPALHAISAAILAGGGSRRMGQDKALLDWGGKPLIRHVYNLVRELASLVDDVAVVGVRAGYGLDGADLVDDDFPGAGALGGIATALRVAQHDRVLVLACDMPLLNVRLLRAMIERSQTCHGVVVPVLSADRSGQGGQQTFETLHAIYPRVYLDAIVERVEAGELKVADALDQLPVCGLDEAWIRTYDPDLMSFFNANTPEQFARARDYARREDRDKDV